jgi:hypothetical protein
MNTGRYHLVLHTAGRTVQHAGWQSETVARQKLSIWAGDWGREGVRITLLDEATGETLTTWPTEG